MPGKQKILIFTSKTGGGHISLAEALADRLGDEYSIEMLDPQPGVIHYHYRLVSRHALWLWSAEFRLSNTPHRSRLAHQTYNLMLGRHVAAALKQTQPDLVMTTYPFLTCEVIQAMRRLGLRLPFAMLLADPNGVHESWLTEHNASAIFAPTRETYTQALNAGFSPEQVKLTGWPVRAQFYRTSAQQPDKTNQTHLETRQEILIRLGLDPGCFTIFLQGGGEGAARISKTVANILAQRSIQVILAAGTNESLLKRFRDMPGVAVLPFTREIAPYMGAADVIMGKAGPNMLFEAVTLGKPFIATAYIPGQEQANLEFIRRYRLGWVALGMEAQRSLLTTLVKYPAQLEEMRASVDQYRVWNNAAADQIPNFVRLLPPIRLPAR